MPSAAPSLLRRLLASPEPAASGLMTRPEKAAVTAAALLAALGLLAVKLEAFFNLRTTSDLYQFVQLSTSWLDGRFLHDNYYGNHFAIHSYLLCPALALVTYPFGALGLLGLLAVAFGAGLVALHRCLRLLGVPWGVALAVAAAATAMPLSVLVYRDEIYGFHVELLVPALAYWYFYFLLRRRLLGSLALAAGLVLVKEDVPLVVGLLALVVLLEERVRHAGQPPAGWNRAALASGFFAVVSAPLLLLLIRSQQAAGAAAANLGRLQRPGGGAFGSYEELLGYVGDQFGPWLGSPLVAQWAAVGVAATGGLILLRPHLMVAGVGTTLVCWLMRDNLLWAPRFVPSLIFFQVAGVLAFASVWRVAAEARAAGGWRRPAGWALLALVAALAGRGGLTQALQARESSAQYRPPARLEISAAERVQADALFARYRRESSRSEPVLAAGYLFRYAHDRNLLWPGKLRGQPRPVWILWDKQTTPIAALWVLLWTDLRTVPDDYEQLGEAGRFVLFKARPDAGRATEWLYEAAPVTGEAHGRVSLKASFAAGRTGSAEPLLSLGPKGAGDLFFVYYLNEHQLVIGMESVGTSIHRSEPVEYEPGREYEIRLFSGSLLPPAGQAGVDTAMRDYFQRVVQVEWEGRTILRTLAPPHPVAPADVHAGGNWVGAGSASIAFTGEIRDVRRGGWPTGPAELGRDFGPVRLAIRLPDAAAGVPEPLLVAGEPGNACLSYVRVLPEGQVKLGVEVWGVGAFESEPLSAGPERQLEVEFELPVLLPPVGDARWGAVGEEEQRRLRRRCVIRVNGAVAVERVIDADVRFAPAVALGRNPVGGSWVTEAFTGAVWQVERRPLPRP